WAQIRGIARLGSAAAEHLVDDGLHVAILVPRMALLEGPPVIAEDLLEGVFVDPLPCGGHRAGLYHVLAPTSTRLCPFIRLSIPIVSPCSDGEKRGFSKKKILIRCIGVGKGSRPPRPPNRAGGFPAHGSPVGGFLIGIGSPAHRLHEG